MSLCSLFLFLICKTQFNELKSPFLSLIWFSLFIIVYHENSLFGGVAGQDVINEGYQPASFGVLFFVFTIMLSYFDQSVMNYLLSLVFLGLGWNFLFISGTSLLVLTYKEEEKFKAQGLNDFSVFTTQATGALMAGFIPVSYTHLRAHETPEHRVCRGVL